MIKKFQFWLLIGLLLAGFTVRLYKINNPIADWHSWRQADTSAVTRNFFKYGINLLYPRYDDLSDVSGKGLLNPNGYRYVEFPIFNLIHYSFTLLFPFKPLEFWGRMTSVFCALFSAMILFFLVRRHARVETGLLAAFFFLFLPYNIYFTRVVLPDPLMVTFFLATLNFFDLWIDKQKTRDFILAGIFGALAVLVKPVAVFFFIPMAWQVYQKFGWGLLKKKSLWGLALLITLPFLAWRGWSYRHPEGVPASSWLLNGDGIRFKGAFFQWIFGERIGSLILGSWGVLLMGAGLIAGSSYFISWAIAAVTYLTVFATGNVRHDYYQIPIIPALAVLLALGVTYLWKKGGSFRETWVKRILVIASVGFMLAFSWYNIRGDYQVNHWEIITAGREVDKITPKDAIVVAPYDGDTAFLYQTNRSGFAYIPFPIKDLIDRMKATYYVSVNYDDQTNAIMQKYTVVEKNPQFVIVKLVEPKINPPAK
jgi:hypothetical protein